MYAHGKCSESIHSEQRTRSTLGKCRTKLKSQSSCVGDKIILYHRRSRERLLHNCAGISLRRNWILIYMSINTPGSLIICKFINLSGLEPGGASPGNMTLTSPACYRDVNVSRKGRMLEPRGLRGAEPRGWCITPAPWEYSSRCR